jgi:hypothetical protein
MVKGNKQPIFLAGEEINQVESCKYLGSIVTIDGEPSPEIAVARGVISQLNGIWKARQISLKLKKPLVQVSGLGYSTLWIRKLDTKGDRQEIHHSLRIEFGEKCITLVGQTERQTSGCAVK